MERIVKAVCATLLMLNIAAAIAVICFVVSSTHDTHTSNTEGLKQEISKIYEERLKIKTDEDNDTHDRKGARQLNISSEILNLLVPVAHFSELDIRGHNVSGTNENGTLLRNWVTFVWPRRQLFVNGMRYEHGSIIIPATGVYAVYSHVKFYTGRNRRGDIETDFHHSILRYNALEQSCKTALADTVSENKNDIIDGASLEYFSDIHGLLQLNAGDQLIVKVARVDTSEYFRDWHYFGAYSI